ncbi:toll/interleukin-1 receptor domain-containing protein [Subtercola vilae]|uniref:TIR domain-containing protein n=1 Tax=Subtercola vilae TaxID=2056433 RepID=A0A4T2C123_9MICO|nr:toll/interleukin-1 receptor domain-containing protein [Subtercola vilae]TIH37379.1 TIR domain-containing protein [Subtercola vilae]
MPIPPILDVFVVWHPDDEGGVKRFRELQDHFHSSAFSGLVGGAVEVYARSEAWSTDGAPRPFGIRTPLADELPAAQFNAIVPVLSKEMARAAASGGWKQFIAEIGALADLPGVGVFSLPSAGVDLQSGALSVALGPFQVLPQDVVENPKMLGRELDQAIAQKIRSEDDQAARITVFVSHSKHRSLSEDDEAPAIYSLVRERIAESRLAEFFDAHDIQVGDRWVEELEQNASEHALLIVRTDRYAERPWTQREVKAAKTAEVPVVTMYAIRSGEQQGSFLMDHVPTVVCDLDNRIPGIEAALDALVTEALKSTLWNAQRSYLKADGFDWLPARSPEPTTIASWLTTHKAEHPDDQHIWIMHPDPPLGQAERDVLIQMVELAGYSDDVNIYTPRTFAARGGEVK